MNKVLTLIAACVILTGCGTMTPKDILKSANMARNLGKITSAGVGEELTNCAKDIFDPANRGSRC